MTFVQKIRERTHDGDTQWDGESICSHLAHRRKHPADTREPKAHRNTGLWLDLNRDRCNHSDQLVGRDRLSPCVLFAANLGHLCQLPTIPQPIKYILHSILGFDPCQVPGNLICNFLVYLELLKNNLFRGGKAFMSQDTNQGQDSFLFHGQNMTVAASATAERKTLGHRS